MESVWLDLRFALRALRKNPGFALIAVVTLSLGIGANSAIFSVVNSVLLQPLPVEDQSRLVRVYFSSPSFRFRSFSYPDYLDIRDRNPAFDGFAAYRPTAMSLSFEGRSERIWGVIATGNYFDVLGVRPYAGRTLSATDDQTPGGHPVAVLSHASWQRRFGGDPGIVGKSLSLNGHPFTVIGIAAEEFSGTERFVAVEIWVPMMMQQQIVPGDNRLESRGHGWLQTIARLAPGTSLGQAQAASAPIAEQMTAEFRDGDDSEIFMIPVDESIIAAQIQSPLELSSILLLAVVAVVLLIACANLANLLLARGESRRREVGLRLALGAGSRRVIRQLLTESLLLALLGGIGGVLLAVWSTRLLVSLIPPLDLPIAFDFSPDLRVLAFTMVLSLVTGVVFGLFPAWQSSRLDLVPALRKGEAAGGNRRRRLSGLLIVSQVAMSLLLLVTAGLFLRSLQNAGRLHPGFNPDRLLLATIDPALHGYAAPEATHLLEQLQLRASRIPGVRLATMAEMVPLGVQGGGQQWGVNIEGYQPKPNERMSLDYNIVTANYFSTMEIPLVEGREFTAADSADSQKVIIVNQALARRYWPDQPVMGKWIDLAGEHREVIGLTTDIKHNTLGEEPLPYMYLPHSQFFNSAMTLHLRVQGDPTIVIPLLRDQVRELDATLPLFDISTMQARTRTALLPARLSAILLGAFGGLALLLSVVGLYGIVSYGVHRRTREIGIRMALGASRQGVLGSVVRRGMAVVAVGLVIGLAAAFGLTRFLEGFLYDVAPLDPVAFAAVTLLLVLIGLLATLVPALRASKVEPSRALRYE